MIWLTSDTSGQISVPPIRNLGNHCCIGSHGHAENKTTYNTALQFLYQRGIKPKQIILYGESLGTGVATKLGTENPIGCVILQSPFTSLEKLSHYHYQWIFIKPWDRFNSLGRITAINAPLLVLHGKQDQIVPYMEGLTIYNTAKEPKKMLSFEQKGNNNLWGSSDFSNEIIQFIRTHCSN